MLALTRKKGEALVLNNDIEISRKEKEALDRKEDKDDKDDKEDD